MIKNRRCSVVIPSCQKYDTRAWQEKSKADLALILAFVPNGLNVPVSQEITQNNGRREQQQKGKFFPDFAFKPISRHSDTHQVLLTWCELPQAPADVGRNQIKVQNLGWLGLIPQLPVVKMMKRKKSIIFPTQWNPCHAFSKLFVIKDHINISNVAEYWRMCGGCPVSMRNEVRSLKNKWITTFLGITNYFHQSRHVPGFCAVTRKVAERDTFMECSFILIIIWSKNLL